MLTARFTDALSCAQDWHRAQKRKGSSTPYIAHLLSVAALVLEAGGTEDEAIAALLHDAIEDQGGSTLGETILVKFGPNVLAICLLYTSPSPRDRTRSRMPSSA